MSQPESSICVSMAPPPPTMQMLPVQLPTPLPRHMFCYVQQPNPSTFSHNFAGAYRQIPSTTMGYQQGSQSFLPMTTTNGMPTLPPASSLIQLPPPMIPSNGPLVCAMCSFETYYGQILEEHHRLVHNRASQTTPDPQPAGFLPVPSMIGLNVTTTHPCYTMSADKGLKRRFSTSLEPSIDLSEQTCVPPSLARLCPPPSKTSLKPINPTQRMFVLAKACTQNPDHILDEVKDIPRDTSFPSKRHAGSSPPGYMTSNQIVEKSVESRSSQNSVQPKPPGITGDVKRGLIEATLDCRCTNKNWHCNLCGRVCSSKSSLRRHVRRHEGLKLFQCTMCSKAYTAKHNLDYHLRSAHPLASPSAIASHIKQQQPPPAEQPVSS